ncbi:MAG: EamA family transporter [Anaerotignum sp.]|nr:EamA family transporter [Anaerotignum sp.]MBO5328940.1 EamA family transporter [Anaerotignum sp.]MBP3307413.1 EamA family transporter [Anaerotignum sp.]MBP3629122.1 EamA family transporter [Anaerotignum sp.]
MANKAKLELIASMFIFGTIGIFVRHIPLPSSMIALVRGFVGAFFVLLFVYLKKSKLDKAAIRKNFVMLALSGAFIGINWILLFESYHYTTVATATLCYYMQPIFVILASPILLKEKLTPKKVICVLVALVGMVFVSGVLQTGIPALSEAKGILYGLGAALFYATVVLMNKKITNISAYDKTIMQLGMGAIVLSPYVMLTQDFATATLSMTPSLWALLLFVGLVHTGVAYALYFDSMKDLKAQTIAIFSYIDPIVAIILSALLLKENMGLYGVIGAVLVLGSTFISELPEKERN